MKRIGKRYNHNYNGELNSRGKRALSKIHRGMKVGNIAKAYQEVEALKIKEGKI